MGSGALLSFDVATAIEQATNNPDATLNGQPLVFVRLSPGVTATAGRADLQRVADVGTKALNADPNSGGSVVQVLSVERPAEIVSYGATGATPAVLATGLALGAIAALGLTLATSVRRRRRELALLKTIGFTRRQLAGSVAWQATVAAVVGVAAGLPLGVALGRQLWDLFAREISAVPQPTVPASVIAVAIGAVVLANVVAAVPGLVAARTPAALVLRSE
jgi:ABC-type antimicrobial peptide transport system permease subunit